MTARQSLKSVFWVAHHLEAPQIIEQFVDMAARELRDRGHAVTICRDVQCVIDSIEDADVMVCWRVLPEMFARARRLKWIHIGSAGIEHTLFPELLASDVILTSVSGIHPIPVSEHVLGLMLALSRRLNVAMRLQIERRYDRSSIAASADELSGKTVGIVGLGKIGLELARICECLGMTVIGTKRSQREGEAPSEPNGRDGTHWLGRSLALPSLDDVLKRADYLVLVLPLTEQTRSLITERELGLMKPSACIINVARGQMIDEEALACALREGRLAGAALDVFREEPLPHDSPLYDLPNLIVTPHVAGSHPDYAQRAFRIFKANLSAFEAGQPMVNVFDRERGY